MQNSISEQARAAALAQLDAAEAAREDILVQHIANGVCINSRTVQIDLPFVTGGMATAVSSFALS